MNKTKSDQPATKKFVQQKFKNVDSQFKTIDLQFKKIDVRFKKIDIRFEKLDKRFEKVDKDIKELQLKTDSISINLNIVKKDLKDFRDEFDHKFDAIMNGLDSLTGHFKKFDTELTIIPHKIADHEDRIEKIEGTVFATA